MGKRFYLLGREFSGADILMGHVHNFVADDALFDAAPHVKAYHTRLKARPAYARALTAQSGGKNASVAAR
jgi:glutathione S-transferase